MTRTLTPDLARPAHRPAAPGAAAAERAAPCRSTLRRAVLSSAVGTAIGWFDFALYGIAASLLINTQFFPRLSDTAAMLASFATFAVGFIARPLGGAVVGHFGDRLGRKSALVFTVTLMGVSTLAIGLLPTFAQIGLLAPVLLVALRFLQGIGVGAEYAGAVTLVAEYAPPYRQAYYTSLVHVAAALGVLLATLCFLLVLQLPEPVVLDWAWRLPFLSALLLFPVALYIRRRVDETPEFLQARKRQEARRQGEPAPIQQLLFRSPGQLLAGFVSLTGHNATTYLLTTFSISYMTNTLGMDRTDALAVALASLATGVLTIPCFGLLADRFGASQIYLLGAGFMLLFAYPLFALLDTGNVLLAALGMTLAYGIGFGSLAGSQGAMLARAFPTRYRYSGIALSRELSGMLVAGPTPFVAAWLVEAGDGRSLWVSLYLMACCALSMLAVLGLRRERAADGGR